MKYVVLDTSVLVNCTLVNASDSDPELLVTLANRLREQRAKLLFPDVVRFEYLRKAPVEFGAIESQLAKFRRSISTSELPGPDVNKVHATLDRIQADRSAAAKRAEECFKKLVSDSNLTVAIPLDGEILAEAVGLALAGKKPASAVPGCLLNPDSLIVASVAGFARASNLASEDVIVFCSNNHKDFAIFDKVSDKHVIAPSIAESLPCASTYHKNLRSLLEQELQVSLDGDKSLQDAMNEYEKRTAAAVLDDADRSGMDGSEIDETPDSTDENSGACGRDTRRTFMGTTALDRFVLQAMRNVPPIDAHEWAAARQAALAGISVREHLKFLAGSEQIAREMRKFAQFKEQLEREAFLRRAFLDGFVPRGSAQPGRSSPGTREDRTGDERTKADKRSTDAREGED